MNSKIISIFCIFLIATLPSAHAINIAGHDVGFDDVGVAVLGGAIGGLAVLGGAALAGVTAPVWVIAGGVAAVGIGANYAYRQFVGKDNPSDGGHTGAKNTKVTDSEFTDNDEIKYRLLAGYRLYSEEAAAADLVEIKNNVKSHITDYTMLRTGQLSQVNVSVYGPNKVYGFSAYPVQIKFKEAITGAPNRSYVQIDKITVYMVDEDGRRWEGKEYDKRIKLKKDGISPDEFILNMTLKTPDPYIGKANNLVTGSFNRQDLDELLNAEVKKFELFVDIKGKAELYREDTYFSEEDGRYITKERFDKTEQIDTSLYTLDVYRGVQNGRYEVSGCSGTLPTDYIHYITPIAYHSWANGAVSNLVMRVWASPCHAYNSTAAFRYLALGIPENLEPISVTLKDDFQAAILRLGSDNSASIAGTPSKGSWSNIPRDYGRMTQISLTYNKLDSTIAFENYFLIVGEVDDGIKSVPIWSLIKPNIAVTENILITLSKSEKEEILELLRDGKVSETDRLRLNEFASISGSSTKTKIVAQEIKENKYSSNSKAKNAHKNALKAYSKAYEYTEKIKNENDPEKIKVYFYLANDLYEPAGDYWSQAAEKYYYGFDDQGDALSENAKKLEQLAKEYEPSMWFTGSSQVKDILKQIKTGFGLGDVSDSVLILCIFLALILLVVIVTKIL